MEESCRSMAQLPKRQELLNQIPFSGKLSGCGTAEFPVLRLCNRYRIRM